MSLRVLHCIHSLTGGGAEKQLVTLINNSIDFDIEQAVFCVNAANNDLNVEACELYGLSNSRNYPWHMIKEISRVIQEFKPDVVHCWLPVTLVAPGLISARLKGLPAVTSFRRRKTFDNIKDIVEFVAGLIFANAVVSNNNPSQSNFLFRYLYKIKNGICIPNAVDVPDKYKLARNATDKKLFNILYVGRLIDEKNWQALLHSLSGLNTEVKWKLSICGSGDDEKVYNLIDELQLSNRVEMMGFRQDVYSVMSQSDVLVLPSWNEGMPNVVLEAMSIGLPCIVSKIPAHESLFKSQPVVEYFEPSKPEELTLIISDYIEGRRDVSIIANNAIEFASDFNPQILLNRYMDFYSKLISDFK